MNVIFNCAANTAGNWHVWIAHGPRIQSGDAEANLSCRLCGVFAFVKGDAYWKWRELTAADFHRFAARGSKQVSP